jgi:methionyl aminopeptidase
MTIETDDDLAGMQAVGAIVAQTLRQTVSAIAPGVRTGDLDAMAASIYQEHGAQSAPTLFFNFPGHILVSVNDEVVHGIPGDRLLAAGDIVKVDVTVEHNGYIADAARTICIPPVADTNRHLARAGARALRRGIAAARSGCLVSDIGRAVERSAEGDGVTVIGELTGHGTGRAIWEDPMVPNFFDPQQTDLLHDGLVMTIEPILTTGSGNIYEAKDGWTVMTADRSCATHWEDTIIIKGGRPIVLTN